jgi:hypothetical protein
MLFQLFRPCSKQFTVFEDVTVAAGQSHDSVTPVNVDCYRYLHYWILSKHAANKAMDSITLTVMFEYPGKMGATGLANLDNPFEEGVQPTPMRVSSGPATCGYGGFVVRVPIVGPLSRVILTNSGSETYQLSVYGYATH